MLRRLARQCLAPPWRSAACPAQCERALSTSSGSAGAGAGLFGIRRLQRPEDFVAWNREAVERSNALIARIMAAPHDVSVVQLMDDISDEMCQVCDAAEACRNIHSDPAWRAAAGSACGALGAYLAEINQHEGMYAKIRDTMERYRRSKEASVSGRGEDEAAPSRGAASPLPLMSAAELSAFCPEAALVGSKLQMDQEKSGVHLADAGARAELRRLMELGQHYPSAFNAALSDPRQLGTAKVPSSLLPPTWRVMARNGRLSLPLDGANLHSFLTSVPDEEARRQVYVAGHSTPPRNLELLDHMIECRSDMAALLGQPSYAHLKAADATLAATPEAAEAFLTQLAEGVRPLADQEAELLRRIKAKDTKDPGAALSAWDLDYYTTMARSMAGGVRPDKATPYLHLESVLAGLSDLLSRLMGLELREEPLGGGGGGRPSSSGGSGGGSAPSPSVHGAECWAPGVRRLAVLSRDFGRLGTLYLDLLSRPGKLTGSVLFPIRCGRQLPDGSYQQPILALVTPCGPSAERMAFTWRELRTFVHEMGHAVHNMVSRTRFQHLWGTRCAQDVVEIPSHLWEHFVTDHRTAGVIARHAASREPLPAGLHSALLAAHNAFPALELQQQVLLALVDLTYFGARGSSGSSSSSSSSSRNRNSGLSGMLGGSSGGARQLDTSAAWADLAARHSSVPPVQGTCPQARFSHLTIYGASYYSYLYARCLAEAVWQRHLATDPLDPGAGMAIRRQLLEPGGAVEPLDLVSGVLGGRQQLQHQHGGWSPRPDALLQSLLATAMRGGGGTAKAERRQAVAAASPGT